MALKIFAPFMALVGVALSAPIYSVPLTYLALTPIPENVYNQVQDTKSGEYAFGYAGGPVAREEAKTSDGVVRGAYSYVDAYGIVQYYRYIADDEGFRVVGTNIPTDGASSEQSQLQEQLKISAEESSDDSEEHSSRRKKRSVLYHTLESVGGIPVAPLTVVAAASVPTATSSQSRVQVHDNLKAEVRYPVQAIASEPIASEAPVKSADAIPIAVAASVPTSTSSQFRHQVHNSARTELHAPAEFIPTKTLAAVPAASVAVPIQLKSFAAIPVAVAAASVPISTSSQSRYQVHGSGKTELHASADAAPSKPIETASVASSELESAKKAPDTVAAAGPTSTSSQSHSQAQDQGPNSVKTELHEPVAKIPIQTAAATTAAPPAVPSAPKSAEALSTPVAASLPTSTSSQSRFQVHSSARTEIHELVDAIPIQPVVAVPATLISAADPVLVATSTQQRFQSHESSKALPASATATTSDQVHIQDNSKVGAGDLSQSSKSKLIDQEPVNGLRLANAFSVPSLARHQIGVGLGVLPSPLVAYHAFQTPLYA